MKANFIKKVFLGASVFFLLFVSSCVKDTLVLPERGGEETNEEIDLISKPTDLQVKGDYNYTFRIDWPEVISQNVESLHLTYYKVEEDEDETVEMKDTVFTTFVEPWVFRTDTVGEYIFEAYYTSKSGLKSNTVVQQIQNKDLYIKDILKTIYVYQEEFSEYKIGWINDREEEIKVSYTTPSDTDPVTSTIETDESGFDFFLALEGEHEVEVSLTDIFGNSVDTTVTYTLKEDSFITAEDKSRWTATASDSHGGHEAERLINGISDGDDHWHSNWFPDPEIPKTMHPFTLEIDFGTDILLNEMTLHARTGGNSDGARFFDLYGYDAETDEYVKLGEHLEMTERKGGSKDFPIASDTPFAGIRLIITESWPTGSNANPANFAHLAEIDVKGFKRN